MIYKVAGLVIITLFYLAYFGKQALLAKRGIKTNRLGRGQKPRRVFWLELALLLATWGMGALQYASVIWGEKYFVLTSPFMRGAGLLLACVGVGFFLSALKAMRDNWRAGVDATQNTRLVTTGVYQASRNPAFVGFDLFYLGSALAFSTPPLLILAAISIGILHLQILEEEKFMQERFGDEYLRYAARARRYL